jgi:hypothetical protein
MSERIELSFTPRNEELIRLGLKRATTRHTRHGAIGDTFLAGGREWEILAIVQARLRNAADLFYRLEGEPSATYFLEEWARCYGMAVPELSYRTEVFVHIFGQAPGGEGSQ